MHLRHSGTLQGANRTAGLLSLLYFASFHSWAKHRLPNASDRLAGLLREEDEDDYARVCYQSQCCATKRIAS